MSLTGGLKLPPIADSGGDNNVSVDGRMITKGGTQQQMIYRSVPPKSSNFTFSDMLGPSPTGQKQSRTTVVSSNTPAEYEERFKSKPLSKPKVVEFDVGRLSTESKRRKVSGFFPPVKLRRSVSTRVTSSEVLEAPMMATSRMQLIPTTYTEVRSKSERVDRTKTPMSFRKTPESIKTAQTAPEVSIIYPNILSDSVDYDDLSLLPPPKRILPRRELPWVFRYKVKRNMNELAKIMASRASPTPIPEQLPT
ncbi:uncharacterized protein LOC133204420 [Saccostrea echinata]|uniref:uncharacterized protein LOC133204420 n=1 Tax=Saccostrea echinata TaxID=191078 RepID=UPI002A809014|nr:uncharacterized protein LOC133204420 [Saccostrea echinata]